MDFQAGGIVKDNPAGISCPESSDDEVDQDPENGRCTLMLPV